MAQPRHGAIRKKRRSPAIGTPGERPNRYAVARLAEEERATPIFSET
jgi:hypothetical protein